MHNTVGTNRELQLSGRHRARDPVGFLFEGLNWNWRSGQSHDRGNQERGQQKRAVRSKNVARKIHLKWLSGDALLCFRQDADESPRRRQREHRVGLCRDIFPGVNRRLIIGAVRLVGKTLELPFPLL